MSQTLYAWYAVKHRKVKDKSSPKGFCFFYQYILQILALCRDQHTDKKYENIFPQKIGRYNKEKAHFSFIILHL